MKFLSVLFILLSTVAYGQLEGIWHSSFKVAGKSLLMDLDIKGIGRDGSVTVSIPDQPKMKPEEMSEYAIFKDSLSFRWTRIGLSFYGKLKNDSLKGNMSQSGLTWPVTFTKSAQVAISQGRPQDPVGPFSYSESELEIKNKKVKIAGTFTYPTSKDFPILILVSGSGAQDRNCEIMGHKPFWVLADYLGKNGVGVFRYDDRGVSKSTGNFESSTENDFATDVLAILSYFQKKFPGHPLGIYGHSEGGMIGLRAAVNFPELRFLIESASVGTSGKDVLVHQQYDIPLASGLSPEMATWNQRLFDEAAKIVMTSEANSFVPSYSNWLNSVWTELLDSLKEGKSEKVMAEEMSLFINTEWARDFLSYRAADYLKEIEIPIFVINGKKDIQVRWEESQQGFKQNMSPKTLAISKFIAYEDLNHLLQPCVKCDVMEYATIETSMSPQVMSDILTWIKTNK
ncbi:MAG: alpha/beta fold hydrolase [Flavobacteriia bacterium]